MQFLDKNCRFGIPSWVCSRFLWKLLYIGIPPYSYLVNLVSSLLRPLFCLANSEVTNSLLLYNFTPFLRPLEPVSPNVNNVCIYWCRVNYFVFGKQIYRISFRSAIVIYLLGLVHTSDGSGIVSEVRIGKKFWSTVNQQDGSDGSRSRIGRKRNSSDPSDSDSVELPTPLTIPLFDLHWIVTLLALLIPTPLPIPSLVWTSP